MNVQDIARAVAAELGDGWTATEGTGGPDWDAYLNGPDGVRLHMHQARAWSQRGRLEITPSLTSAQHDVHYAWSDGAIPEITVSPDKAARRIAGDVTRRLLPKWLPLLATLNERVEQRADAKAALDVRVGTLSRMIPHATVNDAEIHFGSFGNGGSIKVDSDGDAHFDIRFPEDKAAKLAEFIGRLQRGEV